MARRGEPDLSYMYASVAVGATVIGSMLTHLPGVVAAARDEARFHTMQANGRQLIAQVDELLDRLAEHRQSKYVGDVETKAIEAELDFAEEFEVICDTETNGFVFVDRLRYLAFSIIDKIAELDAEAELNARLSLAMLDIHRGHA